MEAVWVDAEAAEVDEEAGGTVWVDADDIGMAAGEACTPTAVVLQRGTGWVWVEEVIVVCGRLK